MIKKYKFLLIVVVIAVLLYYKVPVIRFLNKQLSLKIKTGKRCNFDTKNRSQSEMQTMDMTRIEADCGSYRNNEGSLVIVGKSKRI